MLKTEKHLTLKGEMLVKFKPYLICDILVNNCPRQSHCGTCHWPCALGGGWCWVVFGGLSGLRVVLSRDKPPPLFPKFLLILIKRRRQRRRPPTFSQGVAGWTTKTPQLDITRQRLTSRGNHRLWLHLRLNPPPAPSPLNPLKCVRQGVKEYGGLGAAT